MENITEMIEVIWGGIKMNWLVILVLVILGICTYQGKRRGFIRTVFALFSTILALMITSWVSPVISKAVQQNETVMNSIEKQVEKVVDFSSLGTKVSDQVNFVDKLPLPKAMKHGLLENNTKDVYIAMAVDNFHDYVCNYIARIIVNAGVYIVVMIIVAIGLAVISETLNLISKLPVINGLNKTAGLLVGLLHGLLIVWVGFICVTVLGSTAFGQYLFRLINDSVVLSTLYNNNLLLTFITNIGKVLF